MNTRREFLRGALALAAGGIGVPRSQATEPVPVDLTDCARVQLPCGRWLSYSQRGDAASSRVVIHHHGLPSCRLEIVMYDSVVACRPGIRILSVDRPGIGGSRADPCASILSWPADLAAFADALGVDRFAVVAPSAGAPYALAAARAMPQRVEKVVLVGPTVPMEWIGKKDGDAAKGIHRVTRHPTLAGLAMSREVRIGRNHPHRPQLSNLTESPTSREVLRDPKNFEDYRQIKIETFRQGSWPVVASVLQLGQPWAYWLGEVATPVCIFEGCEDKTVPPEVARLLATALPNAEFILVPGEGHLSLPVRHPDLILDAALRPQ